MLPSKIGVFLVLFFGRPGAVEGLAAKGVYYFDDECGQGQETGTYFLAFGSHRPDPESNTSFLGGRNKQVCQRVCRVAV